MKDILSRQAEQEAANASTTHEDDAKNDDSKGAGGGIRLGSRLKKGRVCPV